MITDPRRTSAPKTLARALDSLEQQVHDRLLEARHRLEHDNFEMAIRTSAESGSEGLPVRKTVGIALLPAAGLSWAISANSFLISAMSTPQSDNATTGAPPGVRPRAMTG